MDRHVVFRNFLVISFAFLSQFDSSPLFIHSEHTTPSASKRRQHVQSPLATTCTRKSLSPNRPRPPQNHTRNYQYCCTELCNIDATALIISYRKLTVYLREKCEVFSQFLNLEYSYDFLCLRDAPRASSRSKPPPTPTPTPPSAARRPTTLPHRPPGADTTSVALLTTRRSLGHAPLLPNAFRRPQGVPLSPTEFPLSIILFRAFLLATLHSLPTTHFLLPV
jgi:hypothetical protein